VSVSRPVAKLLLGTLKYFGAYLLGFFAGTIYANAVAPYDIGLDELFKFAALPTLMFGSLRGLYFFFQTALTEFPDLVLHAWWAVLILLIPFVCEAMVCCRRKSSFRFWRPLWIGFPVGFLGMLGAYWMALQSIP
jgi:hypothetical protein